MAAAVCTHLCSCTSVDFYESKNSKAYQTNKDEKGFLYYPPKPYLLVEQTKESEKFSILSIPDVSRPHRVKQIPGIGTGELGFEINSGMIVKFNSKTDSKTPEIISALTSIGTAKAALVAAKVATETATKTLEQDPANVTKITTQPFTFIVVPIQESIKELRAALVALRRPAQGTEIFRTLIERIENQIKELESRRTITYPINKPDELLKKVDDARKIGLSIVSELSSVNEGLKTYTDNPKVFATVLLDAKQAYSAVAKSIEVLEAFITSEQSSAGLYEIEYFNGRLVLRKVIVK